MTFLRMVLAFLFAVPLVGCQQQTVPEMVVLLDADCSRLSRFKRHFEGALIASEGRIPNNWNVFVWDNESSAILSQGPVPSHPEASAFSIHNLSPKAAGQIVYNGLDTDLIELIPGATYRISLQFSSADAVGYLLIDTASEDESALECLPGPVIGASEWDPALRDTPGAITMKPNAAEWSPVTAEFRCGEQPGTFRVIFGSLQSEHPFSFKDIKIERSRSPDDL